MTNRPDRILIIDDEIQIRRFVRAGFEMEGYDVEEAASGQEGLRAATIGTHDLIILDLGLPDMDGSDVLARLRSWSEIALIVLSVRSAEAEKVKLLELGADDYVVKPFGMAELLARARAALRHRSYRQSGQPVVEIGPLVIEFPTRNVWLSGVSVALTPKEYGLLSVLARHAGNVVTQHHLLREVWGAGNEQNAHYLRIVVRKLRRKIEKDPTDPRLLLTELGVGYRLAA
jgi:two-component system, OmpR family, KDP operon response regulator KdpE